MTIIPRSFIIIILLLLFFLQTPPPVKGATTVLSVWSRDYFSPHIADPSLGQGNIFTLEISASDIPPVIDNFHGGINSFDIIVTYDPTVLNATSTSFKSPGCLSADGCLFDSEATTAWVQSTNVSNGTIRLAVSKFDGAVWGSGTLFKILFKVVGTGFASIDILESASLIIGPVSETFPYVAPLPHQSVDGSFDNRPPFALSTSPSFAGAAPGDTVAADVDVFLVWKSTTFTDPITLTSTGEPAETTVTFAPTTGAVNFTSQMTITTSLTTPRGTFQININAAGGGFTATTTFTLAIGVRNIAVVDVDASHIFATVGDPVTITATVMNQGFSTETFSVSAVVGFYTEYQRIVGTETVTLGSGETTTVSIVWDTTRVTTRTNPTAAEISILPEESDTTDNSRAGPTVTLNRVPTARFNITPTTPVAGQAAQFDATTSNDPDGSIITYEWLFGDGSTAGEKTVTHTYTSPGTYNVTLTVTDNDGDVATTHQLVTVTETSQPLPVAPLTGPVLFYSASAALVVLIVALVLFARRLRKPEA